MAGRQIDWYLSWPISILTFLILIWPVGLVLLWLRIQSDREYRATGGTSGPQPSRNMGCLTAMGIASVIVCGSFLAINLAYGHELGCVFFLAVIFGLTGALTWILGLRLTRKANSARHYIELVRDRQLKSVDSIASHLERSDIAAVMAELQAIFDHGYLPGYSLDPATRMIAYVQPATPNTSPISTLMTAVGKAQPQPRRVTFECASCGAKNEADTTDGLVVCEYCDGSQSV